MARWRGHVAFTAPGDFPEQLGRDMDVMAPSIEDAIAALKARVEGIYGLNPVVTRIERTKPPWREPEGSGDATSMQS